MKLFSTDVGASVGYCMCCCSCWWGSETQHLSAATYFWFWYYLYYLLATDTQTNYFFCYTYSTYFWVVAFGDVVVGVPSDGHDLLKIVVFTSERKNKKKGNINNEQLGSKNFVIFQQQLVLSPPFSCCTREFCGHGSDFVGVVGVWSTCSKTITTIAAKHVSNFNKLHFVDLVISLFAKSSCSSYRRCCFLLRKLAL